MQMRRGKDKDSRAGGETRRKAGEKENTGTSIASGVVQLSERRVRRKSGKAHKLHAEDCAYAPCPTAEHNFAQTQTHTALPIHCGKSGGGHCHPRQLPVVSFPGQPLAAFPSSPSADLVQSIFLDYFSISIRIEFSLLLFVFGSCLPRMPGAAESVFFLLFWYLKGASRMPFHPLKLPYSLFLGHIPSHCLSFRLGSPAA